MTTAKDDAELQQVLRVIKDKYNSDEDFKTQIKQTVRVQSESFLRNLVVNIVGVLSNAILKPLLAALSRLF